MLCISVVASFNNCYASLAAMWSAENGWIIALTPMNVLQCFVCTDGLTMLHYMKSIKLDQKAIARRIF